MSDSDKTNELDNYGVWVKKPPRTVSSELGENTASPADANTDFGSDLPDFSNVDVVDTPADDSLFDNTETAISSDEVEDIAAPSGETEEISLDEFIEGGVFEGDEDASAPSTPVSEPKVESTSSDNFTGSDDITISDSPSTSDSPSLSDDGPLDIDLSFDDSSSSSSPSVSDSSVQEVSGSEDVDLSDFGVDFGNDSASSSAPAAETSSDGTESVDLSDFGVDFSDDSSSSDPEPAASSDEPKINDDGTEEISLDSFGFDINAEESTSDSNVSSEPAPQEQNDDNEAPSLSDDTISFDDSDSQELSLESNSDIEDVSLESSSPSAETEDTQSSSETSSAFTSQDDDDFDLDSIMDSIEDENGNTSSLNDNAIVNNETPATEEVSFTDSSDEQTVIEEPEVNDIVDMEEPVFEETSVDLSDDVTLDIPEETTANISEDSNFAVQEETTSPEKDNPFTLPPDDAFTAVVTEEPTLHEDSDESTVEDVSFDTPAFEEPVTEPVESSQIVEESISEEMPVTPQEEVKQDSEISSATNNILNQIASELSSLRSEISNLKTEFEELKSKEASAPQETQLPEPQKEEQSNGGFFGDSDEDDTIALSLDEMDNILNTVEIVEEEPASQSSEQETATEDSFELPETEVSEEPSFESSEETETFDFSDDNVEEPVLDDIDTEITDDETLPDEITVPKNDDIVVESSDESLIEESPAVEDFKEELAIDEPFVFDETEQSSESEIADDANDTTLSADELANIAAGSNFIEETAEETPVQEESEIEETPASDNISISEGELDDLLTSEAALAESNRMLEEEEKKSVVESTIPATLQKEIKSVLSYMDQLLENLPEEKIAEFAQSEQFETYKKLFKELGLE